MCEVKDFSRLLYDGEQKSWKYNGIDGSFFIGDEIVINCWGLAESIKVLDEIYFLDYITDTRYTELLKKIRDLKHSEELYSLHLKIYRQEEVFIMKDSKYQKLYDFNRLIIIKGEFFLKYMKTINKNGFKYKS